MAELRECPRGCCDGEVGVEWQGDFYGVCLECLMRGPSEEDEIAAAASWNALPRARAPGSAMAEEILLANIRPHLVRFITDHGAEIDWRLHESATRAIAGSVRSVERLGGSAMGLREALEAVKPPCGGGVLDEALIPERCLRESRRNFMDCCKVRHALLSLASHPASAAEESQKS